MLSGKPSPTGGCNVHQEQAMVILARVHHVKQVSWQIRADYSTWLVAAFSCE